MNKVHNYIIIRRILVMKRKTYSIMKNGISIGCFGTTFSGTSDEPTGVRFNFNKLWGDVDLVDETMIKALPDFAGSLMAGDYCADLKCTLSTCPGDFYYLRFNGNRIMIQDSERTILAAYEFDEIKDVSDSVYL